MVSNKLFITLSSDDDRSFKEIYNTITSYGDVKNNIIMYDTDYKHDKPKLRILSEVVSDILANEPSDADLNHNQTAIDLYDRIHELKDALEEMGY